MSDLATVADHLVDAAVSTDEVDAIVAALEFLDADQSSELTPQTLATMLGERLSQSAARSLLYSMEEAAMLSEEGLDDDRLRTVAGAARTAVDRGHRPENDVVVTVPHGDDSGVGRSLGSLAVRFVELVASADEEIVILNPFFTERAFGNIVSPVVNALDRGVSVTLITRYLTYGSDGDSRDFVDAVRSKRRASGGELTLYEYVAPDDDDTATIHTKMTIVDRKRAYLGTANLTHRGLHENLEVGVIFRDDTVSQLVTLVDDLRDSAFLHEVKVKEGSYVRS